MNIQKNDTQQNEEQKQQETTFCGYVAVIGRANVGKSSLLNKLLNNKIAIVSPKPQTTRNKILCINTKENTQLIYMDTPGIQQDVKSIMNKAMNKMSLRTIKDADVIVLLVEVIKFISEDQLILEQIANIDKPVILAINKVDLLGNKDELLPIMERMSKLMNFTDVVPISVTNNTNLDKLENILMNLMPKGPYLFDAKTTTDASDAFMCAELIREQLMYALDEEVPYSCAVITEHIKYTDIRNFVSCIIWVERDGQKAIVIGRNGFKLTQIGGKARNALESFYNKKVTLKLQIKVKRNWVKQRSVLKRLDMICDFN